MTDLGLIVFDSDVLRDKNVLITGGSRGIGAKTAYFLAQGELKFPLFTGMVPRELIRSFMK